MEKMKKMKKMKYVKKMKMLMKRKKFAMVRTSLKKSMMVKTS